jgi:hypothetical protein
LELRKPFKFNDGDIYIGEWNKISNLIEGFGQMTNKDGDYGEGYFKSIFKNGLYKQFSTDYYYEG